MFHMSLTGLVDSFIFRRSAFSVQRSAFGVRRSAFAFAFCLALRAHAQEHLSTAWSTYVGHDSDNDAVHAAAVDSATNSFLAGRLGSLGLHNNGGDDFWCSGYATGFILKASPDGALLWARDLDACDAINDRLLALALSPARLFAAGYTEGSPSDTDTYALIAALDPADGALLWADTSIGHEAGTNGFNAVAAAPDGSVYAVGHTTLSNQTCNVPGYTVGATRYGTNLIGGLDALVVKYAADGAVLWRHYLGGVNADAARAVAVAPDGAVYIAGETRSPDWTSLASGTASATNAAGFLVKLTAAGAHVWSALLTGNGHDAVHALRADPASAALFLGGATASADFLAAAPHLNSHAGATDGFVARVTDTNTAFRVDWCRFVGGSAADQLNALDLLSDGRLAAGGTTASGGWFAPAPGSQPFQGVQDGFAALFNATNGAPSWATCLGGANADQLAALARAPHGFITAGTTFSPDWVGGGFWDEWTKDPDYGPFSFGFAALWQPGAPIAPAFTAEPADRTVQEGASVTFSAAATGTAPLFYRWQRNGAPLAGATATNLTFTAAYADDGATYACTVSNLAGTATSRAALLTVIPMGTLTVTLTPADAVARGARWRLDGVSPWLASGTATNLPAGSYTVGFNALAGWLAPAPLAGVEVAHAATLALQAAYTPILPEADRAVAGTNVTLTVRAPAGLVSWSLTETLPPGLTPFAITGGGVWNGTARTLTFSGTEAVTNTLAYSVACATSGLYTVTGTLAVPHVSGTVPVAGISTILNAKLVRAISGTNVVITVLAAGAWPVTEIIPAGLTPSAITGGAFNSYDDGQVFWYVAAGPAVLSYTASGEPGSYALSGYSNAEPIFGDSVLVIPGAEVPPPDILAFAPAAPGLFTLTFTSVVDQAYAVLTNAAPGGSNGWAACIAPVAGAAGTTQVQVPAAPPRLFYRVQTLAP